MSITTLNETLRKAKESSTDSVRDPAGTKPLDEVLLSDLYADNLEATFTTTFITIVSGPGYTLSGNTCRNTIPCNCASVDAEVDEAVPVRFDL